VHKFGTCNAATASSHTRSAFLKRLATFLKRLVSFLTRLFNFLPGLITFLKRNVRRPVRVSGSSVRVADD
jgi:hypothetical protein